MRLIIEAAYFAPEEPAEVEKQAPGCYHDVQHFLLYGDLPLFSILLLILLMKHPDPITNNLVNISPSQCIL